MKYSNEEYYGVAFKAIVNMVKSCGGDGAGTIFVKHSDQFDEVCKRFDEYLLKNPSVGFIFERRSEFTTKDRQAVLYIGKMSKEESITITSNIHVAIADLSGIYTEHLIMIS